MFIRDISGTQLWHKPKLLEKELVIIIIYNTLLAYGKLVKLPIHFTGATLQDHFKRSQEIQHSFISGFSYLHVPRSTASAGHVHS